ncbi:MAG TPA: formyltransferase family protein [Solirubrobacterales bacterium]|nr:formyltransferase family protein [Solirubrobacterales bacterium]
MKVVLFANHHLATSISLTAALLAAAASHSRLEVVAIVEAARLPPGRARLPRELAVRLGRRLGDPFSPAPFSQVPAFTTLAALARRYRVPLLVPPTRAVNHPALVERLATEIRPDASLSLMVDQIFRPALLAACGEPINYHNAALPAYRGIGAPEWGIYRGDRSSSYTFHRMTEDLDAGSILVDGSIPVPVTANGDEVERAKTARAAAAIPVLFEQMLEREPGRAQEGEVSTFTLAELEAVRDVGDGSGHTYGELERRLRAFGSIKLTHRDELVEATAIRPAGGASALTSADGRRFAPSRIAHLRPSIFRLYSSTGLIWSEGPPPPDHGTLTPTPETDPPSADPH